MTTDKKSQDGKLKNYTRSGTNLDESENIIPDRVQIPNEFWIEIFLFDPDDKELEANTYHIRPQHWPNKPSRMFVHAIESSAYLALQKELEAAKAGIEYLNRMLADERSGDCDKDKRIRLLERQLADARRQIEELCK